ncbi:MAG: peptidoglycan DD-metalloendopeptidase family protein [Candidatus Harrisonbacteria bacterium]|nr:peptidoglycan DD-metalloendopeptidase family protein [Candidatus Harrisonbacteria bacterium]
MNHSVIPAKAGIQQARKLLDSRFRGNDTGSITARFSFFPLFLLLNFVPPSAFAATPIELQKAIEEKNRALQEISLQIQSTRQDLIETEVQSKDLKQELGRINYSLNQVNLGIRSSEILLDKLDLEIRSLESDIADTETRRDGKRSAVQRLLLALQQKDNESQLLVLLRNRTLAENLLELQTINTLSGGLALEVETLGALQKTLAEKLAEQSGKKRQTEAERGNLAARKAIAEEEKGSRQALLAQTKNQEKLFQQLIATLESKQQAISEEVEAIEARLRTEIDPALLPSSRHGVLELPVKGGRFSQNFGSTPFARQGGYRGKFHNGLDIAAPIGTPIYAAEDGTVVNIDNQDRFCKKGAYGRYIVISHTNNLTTLYAHLSLVAQGITEGKSVKRGELIGYVGKTGYATGPHLHLTVYASPTFYMGKSRSCGPMPYGGYLNPADYL